VTLQLDYRTNCLILKEELERAKTEVSLKEDVSCSQFFVFFLLCDLIVKENVTTRLYDMLWF